MGKIRDLFKLIGNTKGTFHAKIGTLKDRNHKDLIKGDEIQKMWQDTQKNCTKKKKNLNDPDNHHDVVTHPEPDILECEVKWALGSIIKNKASGDD